MKTDKIGLVKAVDADDNELKIMSEKTLNEDVTESYWSYFYLVSGLGLVTNIGITLIIALAHDLAELFDKKHLMGLFLFFENVFSIYVWYANSTIFINIKHQYRLVFNSLLMIISYLLIAVIIIFNVKFGFYLALFCAVLHGFTQAFGASAILGLLKGFPSKLVVAFTTGIGTSGIFSTGILMILKPFLNVGFIFLLIIPLTILYLINSIILVNKRAKYIFIDETSISRQNFSTITNDKLKSSTMSKFEQNKNSEPVMDIGDDAHKNLPMNFSNTKTVMEKSGWYIINLFLIYTIQYCCIISFAEVYSNRFKAMAASDSKINENSYFIKNAYVIFCF